jgi:hypothetical protein
MSGFIRRKNRQNSMDKKTMGNWIMYYEVQRLLRDGFSKSADSKWLVLNPRTVSKYAG